jgi:hypothetical protein
VKSLAAAGDHEKISIVINLLTNEFTASAQANHRKVRLFFSLKKKECELFFNFIVLIQLRHNFGIFICLYAGRIDRTSSCNSRVNFRRSPTSQC